MIGSGGRAIECRSGRLSPAYLEPQQLDSRRSPVVAAPQLKLRRARAHSQGPAERSARGGGQWAVGSGHGRGAAAPRRGPRSIMIGGWQGAIQQLWRRGRPAEQGAPHRRVARESQEQQMRQAASWPSSVRWYIYVDRRDRGPTYVHIRRALVLEKNILNVYDDAHEEK